MQIEEYRAIERIIIILIAGASVTFGWNLFKIGVVSESTGTFQGKGWRITLQKAGPGLFFALFGTAICITSLISTLNVNSHQTQTEDTNSNNQIIHYLGESGTKYLHIAQAINTLKLVSLDEIKSESRLDALKLSISTLHKFNNDNMQQQFKDELRNYTIIKGKDPNSLTTDEIETKTKIDPYFKTFIK